MHMGWMMSLQRRAQLQQVYHIPYMHKKGRCVGNQGVCFCRLVGARKSPHLVGFVGSVAPVALLFTGETWLLVN
jgi:hypothetical protein